MTVLGVALLVNVAALLVAWYDQRWFALMTAAYFGPTLNLLIAATSLALIPRLRRRPSFPTASHTALSLLVTAALAGANAAIILSMPLHGC